MITCYIDKISSPVLDDVFRRARHFDIYILRLSVRRLHVLFILTRYSANIRYPFYKWEHLLTLTVFGPMQPL